MKSREETLSPVHKVGIKILSDIQMNNVFPNYMDVINRIEGHRKWLEDHQMQRLKRYQYNLMYDNVISIFGKRGTGKTSVAFTLHKKLEEDVMHSYDIVLPIIIPEVIPADGSALGWVLAIVKDQVKEFEKRLQKVLGKYDYQRGLDDFWNNCKVERMGEMGYRLSEELDKLVELFHSAKYNPANELSYNIAVGNSVKQSQNYYEFAKAIVAFWDHWIAEIRRLYSLEHQTKDIIAPLIYFIFDDVDLAPQKVDELLSIIIKYLSHPNIIVITTADEEMFLEVIEERLDHDIGRLPKEWRVYLKSNETNKNVSNSIEGEPEELVRKTARRYLGKVMPTSTRYYLKLFNTVEEKQRFHLDEGKGLWDGICSQVQRLLEYSSITDNFLTENHVERDYYLNFLGNTSRQLGNVYIGISDFIDCLIEKTQHYRCMEKSQQEKYLRQYVEAIYNSACRFLHISINSNHDLAEKIKDVESFINEAFWLEHNEWLLYINYAYLDEYLKKSMKGYPKIDQVKIALQLYSLFHFTENIFVILEKCTEKGITGRRKIHGFSYLRDFLCDKVFNGKQLFRKNIKVSDFFAHYKTVLNRIDRFMEEGLQEKALSREYFYDFSNVPDIFPEDMIFQAFRKDKDWLQEIAEMLSNVYGNFYLFGKRELENCRLYEPWESLCRYQKLIQDLLEEDIYKTIDKFDLYSTASSFLKQENNILNQKRKSKKQFYTMAIRYKEQFINNFKTQEENSNLNGKNEQNNKGQTKLVTNKDKSLKDEKIEMQSIMIKPVYDFIKQVNQDLEGKDIVDVINLLPEEESLDIKKRLTQESNVKGVLSILKMLYSSISEWDYSDHNVYIQEIMNLYDAAKEYEIETDNQKELDRLADYIYQYIPEEYEQEYFPNWYFVGGTLYREIKDRLNRVRYACQRERKANKYEVPDIKVQLERIEREFDAAFLLENTEEFYETFLLAVKVHLAIRIQRIYLYNAIVENYDSDYTYSSKTISKNYYYNMFLEMVNLMNKKNETLTKEQQMIKNFIMRAASQNKKKYIRSMLQEVKNESISN